MKTLGATGFQQWGFNLRQAFPKNWPKIKSRKWAVSEPGFLEHFWKRDSLEVVELEEKHQIVSYWQPCVCEGVGYQFAGINKLSEMTGPHICEKCQKLFLVKPACHN